MIDSVDLLRAEYLKRQRKNPRYSLRRMAEVINIPSGRLSQILSRDRNLTLALGDRISCGLSFDPETKEKFLKLICNEKKNRTKSGKKKLERSVLPKDIFSVIADWYHFAILSLMNTVDFKSDVSWIAKRLKITGQEVRSSLEILTRLKLIEEKEGSLRRTKQRLQTTDGLPFPALRRAHRQSILQAIEALETTTIEERSVTSTTMAINPCKIVEAKKLIAKFREDMERLLETGPQEEVYNLNIQLVPLSKKEITSCKK